MKATPVLHLVTCGSVDDGKSTLIGRLLAETDSVPVDQLEYARTTRRGGSTIPIGEVDFSLLTDGLEAEREQGITIDVAYRHMNLPNGRRVLIADAPGSMRVILADHHTGLPVAGVPVRLSLHDSSTGRRVELATLTTLTVSHERTMRHAMSKHFSDILLPSTGTTTVIGAPVARFS